jgi:thioredoxin 1
LTTTYEGKLTFGKINIDDKGETASKYEVPGPSTLTLFKNGEVEASTVGTLSIFQVAAFIDANL